MPEFVKEWIKQRKKLNLISFFTHDDFYFCPNWDEILNINKKINIIDDLSGIMMNNGPLSLMLDLILNVWWKIIRKLWKINHYDFQDQPGSHLIHKEIWNKVGGFSEEFYPGTGQTPDLNMKLW